MNCWHCTHTQGLVQSHSRTQNWQVIDGGDKEIIAVAFAPKIVEVESDSKMKDCPFHTRRLSMYMRSLGNCV